MAEKKPIPVAKITKFISVAVLIVSAALITTTTVFINSVFQKVNRPQQIEPSAVKTQQVNLQLLETIKKKFEEKTAKTAPTLRGLRNPFATKVVAPPPAPAPATATP